MNYNSNSHSLRILFQLFLINFHSNSNSKSIFNYLIRSTIFKSHNFRILYLATVDLTMRNRNIMVLRSNVEILQLQAKRHIFCGDLKKKYLHYFEPLGAKGLNFVHISIFDTVIERKGLQKDLDYISVWMREWKIKLNVAKCKVVHFDRSNLETNFQIHDEYFNYKIQETTEYERDLGIIFSSNFDWKEQINSALNIASRVLGMLKRTFVSSDTDLWKKFYTSMI